MKSFIVILIVSLLGLTALHADDWQRKVPESDRARQNPIASNSESLGAGKQLYADKCAKCHGTNGEGKGHHPSLQTKEAHAPTAGELEWLIAHGNRWRRMPAFGGLSDEQRWQLVSYIQSLPTDSK